MRVRFSSDHLSPRDRERFRLDFVAKHVKSLSFDDLPDPAALRALLDTQAIGRFTLYGGLHGSY